MATTSRALSRSSGARSTLRPMRPNPLMAMRVMSDVPSLSHPGSFRSPPASGAASAADSGGNTMVHKDRATPPGRAAPHRADRADQAVRGRTASHRTGRTARGLAAMYRASYSPRVKVRRYSLGVVPRMRWSGAKDALEVQAQVGAGAESGVGGDLLDAALRALQQFAGEVDAGAHYPLHRRVAGLLDEGTGERARRDPRLPRQYVEGQRLAEPVQRPLAGGGEPLAARLRHAARYVLGLAAAAIRGPRPGVGPRGWRRPRRGRRAGCAGTGRCRRPHRPR